MTSDSRNGSARSWHRTLLLLLMALATTAHSEEKEALPHFDFSKQGSYLLPEKSPWVPGRTTMVTFGQAHEPMQIHMGNMSGGEDSLYSKSKSCHLMFKCSSEDSGFQEIALVNSSVSQHWYQTDRFCEGGRQFKLQKLNSSVHELTLMKATNISFEQSFKHLMEFRVRVEFQNKAMYSSSLFIYSIDAVMNLNSKPATSGGYTYTRFFLTKDAIQFLTGRTKQTMEPLMRVNFLEKKFVDLLRTAPAIISSYLSVVVTVSADPACAVHGCSRQYDDAVFTSSMLDWAASSLIYRRIYFRLGADFSLQTGILLVGHQDFNAMYSLLKSRSIRVSLAVSMDRMIALNSEMVVSRSVIKFAPLDNYTPNLVGSHPNQCTVPGKGSEESLTLFMDTGRQASLDCPFVCSQRRKHCIVYRDGKVCNELVAHPKITGFGESCSGIGSVNSDGSTTIFPLTSHSSHLITYKFALESQNYTYRFTLAEPPLFSSWRPERLLPPVTYANLDMRVSFTCTVAHSALDRVLMSAYIEMLNIYALPAVKWREMTPSDFVMDVLGQPPNLIIQRMNTTRSVSSLHVILPHVTEAWKFLQLAFVCRVEMYDDDARRMLGIPHYQTETRTSLRVVGSRLALHNLVSRSASKPALGLALLQLLVAAAVVQLSDFWPQLHVM